MRSRPTRGRSADVSGAGWRAPQILRQEFGPATGMVTVISLTPCFSKVLYKRQAKPTVLTVLVSAWTRGETVKTVISFFGGSITSLKRGVNERRSATFPARRRRYSSAIFQLADGCLPV